MTAPDGRPSSGAVTRIGRAGQPLVLERFSSDRADDVARAFNEATAAHPYCATLTAETVRDRLCAPSYFDPAALLIAYRGGRPVGYATARSAHHGTMRRRSTTPWATCAACSSRRRTSRPDASCSTSCWRTL